MVADGSCYPSLHDGSVVTTYGIKVVPVRKGVIFDAMEYGEVGGVDVDFDHLLTTYYHLLTLSLFDGLVAVVADTIKTTTSLEVEALDFAFTEEPLASRKVSAF